MPSLPKRLAILGGTGNTGIKIADLLLQYTKTQIVLGARNKQKLEKVTRELSERHETNRISFACVDILDSKSLHAFLKDADMVIVASATADFADRVVQCAIKTNTDYLDIHYSSHKLELLKNMKKEIDESDSLIITEAGFHPGLPSALIRYADKKIEDLSSAIIGGVLNVNWADIHVNPSTEKEFASEIADFRMEIYEKGQWKKASMWSTKDLITMDVGEPIGERMMSPMFFEELYDLPERIPSLEKTGFYIAGTHWFSDYIIMPIVYFGLKLFPKVGLRLFGKLLFWSWAKFSKPPYRVVIQLEAMGTEKTMKLCLSHDDGYWFTAIPVVACIKQYLSGQLPQTGLHYMGHIVEPDQLLNDMKMMGVNIIETILPKNAL